MRDQIIKEHIKNFKFKSSNIKITKGESIEWEIKDNRNEYNSIKKQKYFLIGVSKVGIDSLYENQDDFISDQLYKGDKLIYKFTINGDYIIKVLNYPNITQCVSVADSLSSSKFISNNKSNNIKNNLSAMSYCTDTDKKYSEMKTNNTINDDKSNNNYANKNTKNSLFSVSNKQKKKKRKNKQINYFESFTKCLDLIDKGVNPKNIKKKFKTLFNKNGIHDSNCFYKNESELSTFNKIVQTHKINKENSSSLFKIYDNIKEFEFKNRQFEFCNITDLTGFLDDSQIIVSKITINNDDNRAVFTERDHLYQLFLDI